MAFLFKEIEKGFKTLGNVAGTAVKEVGKGTADVVGGVVSMVNKEAGKQVKNTITNATNTVGNITGQVVGTGGGTGKAVSAINDIISGKKPDLGNVIGGSSLSPANTNPLSDIQGITPKILKESEEKLTEQAINEIINSNPSQQQNQKQYQQQLNQEQLQQLQLQQQQQQMMYIGGFILLLLLLRRRR